MSVQVINLILFVVIIGAVLYCFILNPKRENEAATYIMNHYILLIVLLIFNTLSFAFTLNKQTTKLYIKRPAFYEQEKSYSFSVNDKEEGGEVELLVNPVKLKPKEAEQLIKDAFSYFDDHLKGENKSLEKVTTDLDISLPREQFPFEVEVRPSDYRLVNEDGTVKNTTLLEEGFSKKQLQEGINTVVSLTLSYEDMSESKDYKITVFARPKSEWEERLDEVSELFKETEQRSLYEEGFEVPANYKNLNMGFADSGDKKAQGILVIGIVVVILLVVKEAEDKKNNDLMHKRNLLLAYPWFVNELVLFLGAGMQIKKIFKMMVEDYKRKSEQKQDYRQGLISELVTALDDFDIGMSEGEIYYRLGRRLKLPCYIKVMTLLEQNVTKGSKGMVSLLEQEERNAMNERINLAKKRGEEAGTKLLGPMILLLLIVMLMIMIPAFLSFA
ncbi:MAG: hypothetical protein E7271_00120 [Lachnospiraceae bacterium]|nr:hypothetical protein [Lachnospiraceae bacterium]